MSEGHLKHFNLLVVKMLKDGLDHLYERLDKAAEYTQILENTHHI